MDNLFIDTALNSARISYPAPHDASWIYEPILYYVKNRGYITPNLLKNHLKTYNPKAFDSTTTSLTDEYLTTLINSAKIAMQKRIDRDYVVKFDPKEGKQKVIIVDFHNTGKLNHGSRWNAGIHEFLEVMNGLKPEAESLTIASISHPSFFSLYDKIYGMTGTIGALEERAEIKTIYNVDFFDVPSHFVSKKQPAMVKFVPASQHYNQILLSIKTQIDNGRPVLVLLQSIQENKAFSSFLMQNKFAHNTLNEIQEIHEQYILNNAGKSGAITVATNNAGRGTDIILSKDSIENGGLHVIVSFLPANLRVEEQACGRSARQGQPGSCEIVISSDDAGGTAYKIRDYSIT